jgi:integral membrane protein (TIGR00529 family)
METLFNTPIILKIIVVFGLILVLIRSKRSLGTALLAGSLLLGLWCRMNMIQIVESMGTTIIQTKTILLNAIVILILILSHSMDKLDQMKRLLSSFQGLVKNAKFNLIVFPAIIGLLPMPGGAIFSAPMVDVLGKEQKLDAETKSLINYWFRHVWEFSWPLYPGPLLAASLASISIWVFVGMAFPLTLISILAGSFFLLRNISQKAPSQQNKVQNTQTLAFLKEVSPIIIVIAGALVGSLGITWLQRSLPLLSAIPTELPLVFSLLISIVFVWWVNKASSKIITSVLVNKALLRMIYMITTIYIFQGILVDSHAVVDISAFLAAQDIPLVLVIIVLPGIVGVISGIAVAFVGTTFPVLISLLQTLQIESSILPYLVLGFCSGFMGVMLSPLHVCLIFTQEYFQSDFRILYRRLWKPVLVLLISAFIYFSILINLGKSV